MMDTTPEALASQADLLRGMTGPERLMIALDMSLFVRELAATRLRLEHPAWSAEDIKMELLRYAFAGLSFAGDPAMISDDVCWPTEANPERLEWLPPL